MSDSKENIRLTISGRVQGVSYRAWMQKTAHNLGLDGWVRNRMNGDVEALAHGAPEKLQELVAACHKGPAFAKVDKVVTEAAECDGAKGFRIESTV